MTWAYSGNPATNEKDKYRFLISDTDANEHILQDEEIEYILAEYTDHNIRLYNLFDKASDIFARKVKRSLGPQSEDPTYRQKHFEEKLIYYRRLVFASGLSLPKSTETIFTKGLHDNVRNP